MFKDRTVWRVLEMIAALKLARMRDAFDELLADGLKRRRPVQRIGIEAGGRTRPSFPKLIDSLHGESLLEHARSDRKRV